MLCMVEALKSKATIVHFHDPHLLIVGVMLRLCGKKVIYDAHEYVPGLIMRADNLGPKWVRTIISKCFEKAENVMARAFSLIIAATPSIAERFHKKNIAAIIVNNYPRLEEYPSELISSKKRQAAYAGYISEDRGIREMIMACALAKVKLVLMGTFESSVLMKKCQQMPEWSNVEYLGQVNRRKMVAQVSESSVGLLTIKPLPNHIESQPNKMFEYMAMGIPVIGSNFPLWRLVLEANQCGLCVDPLDPRDIANAILDVIADPKKQADMGKRGSELVKEKYNWDAEGCKLLQAYRGLDGQ